jgi:EAL domain-containing protein (putative c-di-GMP-specific phosphodiesterase class I)
MMNMNTACLKREQPGSGKNPRAQLMQALQADLRKIRVIAMASQRFGLRTIAEFVESDDTLEKLRGIGVDYAQGFGIGRPGPITQPS